MALYVVKTKVDQIVTREVVFKVVAGSEEEAEYKSREALNEYPKPIKDQDIKKALTVKQNYWIPRSIEIVKIEKEKNNG